jgi:hypothetical protein
MWTDMETKVAKKTVKKIKKHLAKKVDVELVMMIRGAKT